VTEPEPVAPARELGAHAGRLYENRVKGKIRRVEEQERSFTAPPRQIDHSVFDPKIVRKRKRKTQQD
jgi:hypothetical protein